MHQIVRGFRRPTPQSWRLMQPRFRPPCPSKISLSVSRFVTDGSEMEFWHWTIGSLLKWAVLQNPAPKRLEPHMTQRSLGSMSKSDLILVWRFVWERAVPTRARVFQGCMGLPQPMAWVCSGKCGQVTEVHRAEGYSSCVQS